MAKGKTVDWHKCPCGNRGFEEVLVEKALGRARAKRTRNADRTGTRRGMVRENRYFQCPVSGLFHLTEKSRRQFA